MRGKVKRKKQNKLEGLNVSTSKVCDSIIAREYARDQFLWPAAVCTVSTSNWTECNISFSLARVLA